MYQTQVVDTNPGAQSCRPTASTLQRHKQAVAGYVVPCRHPSQTDGLPQTTDTSTHNHTSANAVHLALRLSDHNDAFRGAVWHVG